MDRGAESLIPLLTIMQDANMAAGYRPTSHPYSVSDFRHDGYFELRTFLNESETATARALVESLLGSRHDTTCNRPNNALMPLRWDDALIQLFLSSEHHMRRLSEAVGAADLKWISGYLSIKEANSPPLWWHQDWWCWDHPVSYEPDAPQIAVLCYLTDTSSLNGALRLLPGSHHRSAAIHANLPEAHSQTAETLEPGHIALADLPGQVTPDTRAGDAIAIDYRLLHGTHPNASCNRRDCILLSFTPSWQRLPDDIKAHLIDHPALPSNGFSQNSADVSHLLPAFDGPGRTLDLNRNAPKEFVIPKDDHR